jgi:hypothetical protein
MSTSHPRPWRHGSLFGDGRRVPLDRERRARFRFLLNAHRRARRLTPTAELVGTALLKRLGADGQCDPAHATLAADVGCSARTVGRATAAMRELGLLRWDQRLIRSGWRTEQTSNAYELVPAAAPAVVLPVPRCGGQSVRETPKDRFIDEDAAARASAAQQLLALGFIAPADWTAS